MPTNFPTSADTFPTAADLADDTLATKPHSTLHGNLGDALTAVEQFVLDFLTENVTTNQVHVTGVAGQTDPLLDLQDSDAATIFKVSPPSASGNVEGFLQVPSGHAFIQQRATQDAGSDARQTLWDWYSETDNSSVYADISVTTNALADGTSRAARAVFSSDLDGTVTFEVSEFGAGVTVKGNAGQTNPLLDVQASDTTSIIEVTGDKKIGFYNKAPVALQTGVAVNAAGIHAALVNLGLITA